MSEPDPHLDQLLQELNRAARMTAAAWRRYIAAQTRDLTGNATAMHSSSEQLHTGMPSGHRTPPV